MGGCGSPKPEPSPNAETKTPDKSSIPVETGRVTITARGEDGELSWVAKASRSSLVVADQASKAMLTDVDGEIYMNGAVASRFSADQAEADNATRELVMNGHVVIKSEPPPPGVKSSLPAQPVEINADRAKWLDDRRVVAAQGSVWVRSSVYQMGEYPELWATQDLRKIGTPDRFQP